jgi:ribonuclease HI
VHLARCSSNLVCPTCHSLACLQAHRLPLPFLPALIAYSHHLSFLSPATLYRPIEESGLNLLDIKARNEAIEITWLKDYLNFSPSRPTWAKITDLILKAAAPPSTSILARINSFLQSWNLPTKGPRHRWLNTDTVRMLKVARKYHTHLAAIRLSTHLCTQLPAWYHLRAAARPLTTRTVQCLLKKHSVATVADLISTSDHLCNENQIIPHTHDPQCICNGCSHDRENECTHPHECTADALARIHLITPKLNPLDPGDIHNNLSLTPSRRDNNRKARATDSKIRFDPTITCKSNLAECFRIFTNPDRISDAPARCDHTVRANHRHQSVTVYTDGACINNGKLNARCGSSIWISPNHAKNSAIRVPSPHQSNQVGEVAAIIAAVNSFPKFLPLTIILDSKYAINGLTTHLHTWEDHGWIGVKNTDLFKRAAFLLRSRIATTDFQWVKGHSGTLGNEESDRLAREGADKPNEDILSLEVPTEFDLQGAKLASISQAIAYRGIQDSKQHQPQNTTTRNLQIARDAIHEHSGVIETDESLWKGTQNPNI